MLANYGYQDASGEFYIAIDTDKCNGCRDCVPACPANVFEVVPDENDPFSDEDVAQVEASARKKIGFSCGPCKPTSGVRDLPCVNACEVSAITHSW